MINFDDGSYIADISDDDDEYDRDPYWLSQMFKYGLVRYMRLTSHLQASQLPQIIQDSVKNLILLLLPSDVGVRYHNGNEITG